jgi:cysteine sulfinate desulfinase/cysteine desulfurase-like protein
MGRSVDEAKSSIRFSFGRYNTCEEIEQLIDAVASSVNRLRAGSVAEAQLVN